MARVLIVQDESTDLIILRDIVEASGHEVFLATGGEQALNLYMGRFVDVVVTDLQMPHMDGLELMVALQKLFPAVAIIVVSGKGPELLAAAMDKGALMAFSKPVEPKELLDAIAQAAPDDGSPEQGSS